MLRAQLTRQDQDSYQRNKKLSELYSAYQRAFVPGLLRYFFLSSDTPAHHMLLLHPPRS